MKKKLFIYMLILTLLSSALPIYAQNIRTAKLIEFNGSVHVKREASEKKIKAFKNMTLAEGDTLYTGEKSKAVLELDSDKKITVSAKSTIVLSELSNSAGSTDTAITLKNGGVGSKIDKKLDKGSRYRIKTSSTVMDVRGTEFYVQSSIYEKPRTNLNSKDGWRQLNSVSAFLSQGVLAVQLLSPDNSALLKNYDDDSDYEFLIDKPQNLRVEESRPNLSDFKPIGLHREFLEDLRPGIGSLVKKEDFEAAIAFQDERENRLNAETVEIPKTRVIESDPMTAEQGEDDEPETPTVPLTFTKDVLTLYLYDTFTSISRYCTLNNVAVDYVINGSLAEFSYTYMGVTYTGSSSLSYVENVDPLPGLSLYAR